MITNQEGVSVLTVGEVNQTIAAVLKDNFPNPFWVTGEVQGYDRDAVRAGARRWRQVYFELVEKEQDKDTVQAGVKALMWGDVHSAVSEKLKGASDRACLQDGLQVKLLCAVDFYWPRASLQLKVLDVDPDFTLGGMERAKRELVERIKREGLYDQNRETLFPLVPLGLGLITSEGSAAYHDFLHELKGSGYGFHVRLVDARMQGEETEISVVTALTQLEADPFVGVIALIRGGGSRSDLLWFDKAKIAEAIARCGKPVVCGIGHEIDLSVADLVAHTSQKTPTAAAGFLVEKVRKFEEAFSEARRTLLLSVSRSLAVHWERLEFSPRALVRGAKNCLARRSESLASFRKECDLKDPRRLLARGYSLVLSEGKLVKSVKDVALGQGVDVQVRDGILGVEILSKRES